MALVSVNFHQNAPAEPEPEQRGKWQKSFSPGSALFWRHCRFPLEIKREKACAAAYYQSFIARRPGAERYVESGAIGAKMCRNLESISPVFP